HSPTLIRNLMRLVKNETLVEEIVHDSFVELWERREQIDPEKSVLAYVYRMASNKAANLFKRAAHDQKLRSYFLRMLDAGYEEIETKLIQKENRELLHQLLERLPPRQREVYMLCKLDGMSYAEVASRLHISESMVNSHIQRANKFLR